MAHSSEPECSAAHVAYCFQSIVDAFDGNTTKHEPGFDTSARCPIFVTLKKWDKLDKAYHLRGCIGSLSPIRLTHLYDYARKSAFEDHRFDPLEPSELPELQIGVSLLVKYEDAASPEDWEVGKHGIILRFSAFGREHSATYLPEVAEEQGWTQTAALESLVHKAGFRGKITKELRDTMKVTRYQSSKFCMTYDEWKSAYLPKATA